jgi:hypothetical protein
MPCSVGQSRHWLNTDNYIKANCFQHALVCNDSQVDLTSQMIHFQFVNLKALATGWTYHLSDLSLQQIKKVRSATLRDRTKICSLYNKIKAHHLLIHLLFKRLQTWSNYFVLRRLLQVPLQVVKINKQLRAELIKPYLILPSFLVVHICCYCC